MAVAVQPAAEPLGVVPAQQSGQLLAEHPAEPQAELRRLVGRIRPLGHHAGDDPPPPPAGRPALPPGRPPPPPRHRSVARTPWAWAISPAWSMSRWTMAEAPSGGRGPSQ